MRYSTPQFIRPRRRASAPPRQCLATFVIVVGGLLAMSMAGRLVHAWSPGRVMATYAAVPKSPDLYLAYYHAGVEHFAAWDDFHGLAAPLGKADVLLLGSSHVKFAFPRSTADACFGPRGLRFYNLGFAYHEGSRFPLALVRRYDLHPRLVICGLDPFFDPAYTEMADRVMRQSRFDGFKFSAETVATFYAQRWVHRFVPILAGQVPVWDTIYYRSARDGTTHLAASVHFHAPVRRRADPTQASWPAMLATAREFLAEMDRRGTRVVFTVDPVSSLADARRFAAELHVPLLVPTDAATGPLFTFDHSHLEPASAIAFSTAFYDLLGRYLDAHPLGREGRR